PHQGVGPAPRCPHRARSRRQRGAAPAPPCSAACAPLTRRARRGYFTRLRATRVRFAPVGSAAFRFARSDFADRGATAFACTDFTGCGAIVSPRASIATSSAIFLFLPASVLIFSVRNFSANRFWRLSRSNVSSARGFAATARRRSSGMLSMLALRMGAYAASQRPSAWAASMRRRPAAGILPAALSRPARGVALKERQLVERLPEPVDPSPTQRDVHRLVGSHGRLPGSLLVDPQPHLRLPRVVLGQPRFEGRLTAKTPDLLFVGNDRRHL